MTANSPGVKPRSWDVTADLSVYAINANRLMLVAGDIRSDTPWGAILQAKGDLEKAGLVETDSVKYWRATTSEAGRSMAQTIRHCLVLVADVEQAIRDDELLRASEDLDDLRSLLRRLMASEQERRCELGAEDAAR